MLPRLFLAIFVITLLFYVVGKYKRGEISLKKSDLYSLLLWAGVAIIVLAVVTGRLHWLGIIFAALLGGLRFGLTFFTRVFPFLRFLSNGAGSPKFSTPFLTMQVDLNTGKLSGTILQGLFEGKTLSELSEDELKQLAEDYRNKDKRSWLLLRSFMIRHGHQFGEGRNGESDNAQQFQSGLLTKEEACQVLGVNLSATKEEILAAHKRLMQKVHPDKGGNDYLAAQVNQAKETLLS